jgi:hypothetical protein
MKYYYLTFYNIGIGFQQNIDEAAYFDLSTLSGPESEFGRLLCSYLGEKIDDNLIERVSRWHWCIEHNLTDEQFDALLFFLLTFKGRHCIEYQISDQAPR